MLWSMKQRGKEFHLLCCAVGGEMFCFQARERKARNILTYTQKGRILLSSLSISHPRCMLESGKRGFIGGSSGFIIDPVGENKCQVRYLIQLTRSSLELMMTDLRGEKGVMFYSASKLSQMK